RSRAPLSPVSAGAMRQDFLEVFVAPSAQAHEDELLLEVARAGQRMRRLQRRDDPLAAREVAKRGERLPVRGAHVLRAARVTQERVLGADAGIVETSRDGVCVDDLAVV